jgi:arylsulfatase A-like enzyme
VIDLMPTVVELAEAEFPREILLEHLGLDPDRPLLRVDTIQPPEGQSLVAALCDPDHAVERTIFWEHEGNRAVRRGRWKLVAYYNENFGDTNVALGKRSGQWELYDVENDRNESNDLARMHPDKVKELSALHRAWEKRIGVRDWQSLLKLGGLDRIPER